VELSGKWKMYYLAEAQAIHRHIKSEKGNPVARFKQWRRSRMYFTEKYSDNPFFGKIVEKTNLRIYLGFMIIAFKIKALASGKT